MGITVVALQTIDEVHRLIIGHLHSSRKDGFARTAGDAVLVAGSDSLGMLHGMVEVIASHKLSCHLVAAVSQSAGRFDTHSMDVKYLLLAAPARRQTIAYAWVLVEVEALDTVVIYHLR